LRSKLSGEGKGTLSRILEVILGKNGLNVMVYHLVRYLGVENVEDIMEVTLTEPRRVLEALSTALGSMESAKLLIRLVLREISRLTGLFISEDEVIKAMERNDTPLLRRLWNHLLNSLPEEYLEYQDFECC